MGNLFKQAFVISLLFTIIGGSARLNHWEYSSIFLTIGGIAGIVYIVVGIYEVNTSNRNILEKILWTIGFIVFNFIAGLLYLLIGHKKVI